MTDEVTVIDADPIEALNEALGLDVVDIEPIPETITEEALDGVDNTINTVGEDLPDPTIDETTLEEVATTDELDTVQDTGIVLEQPELAISPLFGENNFPTDVYGLTSEVKAAYKTLGSRIAGNREKYELAKTVLHQLTIFLDTKFAHDVEPNTTGRGVVVTSGGA